MVTRACRLASIEEWRLAPTLSGERREQLLSAPQPDSLLNRVIRESENATEEGNVALIWQPSDQSPRYFRAVVQIRLTAVTFDQFFNGRSGYRAQYYLSPEEGILYNRDTLDGLIPVIEGAFRKHPLQVDLGLFHKSLRAPHAKVWVFSERDAFREAPPNELNPPRWVDNGAELGRRAPFPARPVIDVKGTFIEPGTHELFIDPMKLDRPSDLFNKGYT